MGFFVCFSFFVCTPQTNCKAQMLNEYLSQCSLSVRQNMSDNDCKDLVSVLPIKSRHLPGAAIEVSAYSSKLLNMNSTCCYMLPVFFQLLISTSFTYNPKL